MCGPLDSGVDSYTSSHPKHGGWNPSYAGAFQHIANAFAASSLTTRNPKTPDRLVRNQLGRDILLVPKAGILSPLVGGAQPRAETQKDHRFSSSIVIQSIQQDLQMPAEVAFPLPDDLDQVVSPRLLVLPRGIGGCRVG